MMITKFDLENNQGEGEFESIYDEKSILVDTNLESEERTSTIEDYSTLEINKPLLSSKKKLSNFLIQRSVSPTKCESQESKKKGNTQQLEDKKTES